MNLPGTNAALFYAENVIALFRFLLLNDLNLAFPGYILYYSALQYI